MSTQITELAYLGNWSALLRVLEADPGHVNSFREPNQYTPLHQAAWHGAPTDVVGALLRLGADPSLKTASKQQTSHEIAAEKHPGREDLQYLLAPRRLSIAQLIRKVVATSLELFTEYDGNQLICDRLIGFFDAAPTEDQDLDVLCRLATAFQAITGLDVARESKVQFSPVRSYNFEVDTAFWSRRLLPLVVECAARGECAPLESDWAVVADLFDPVPRQWGLRGDLFLWLEMRRAVSHVRVPENGEQLELVLRSAYAALVGAVPSRAQVFVPRFARGGMSSGTVDGLFWERTLIPSLLQRFDWLRASWTSPTI